MCVNFRNHGQSEGALYSTVDLQGLELKCMESWANPFQIPAFQIPAKNFVRI